MSTIKSYKDKEAKQLSAIPLDTGIVYSFDGQKFAATTLEFRTSYPPGTMLNGNYYYCIWPEGADALQLPRPPNIPAPPATLTLGVPAPGDFCYLHDQVPSPADPRVWVIAPERNTFLFPMPADAAAMTAKSTYERLLRSSLQSALAFGRLTEGWEGFNDGVDKYLVAGDRDGWLRMPKLV